MLKIEMIDKRNRELFIDRIRSNVTKHIFAFYDIQFDPDHTTIHAAFENDDLIGYLLLYTATDVPSVILECEPRVAEKLIQNAPENNFIMHTSPDLLNVVNRNFPNAKNYLENWMFIRKDAANPLTSKLVRRLSTQEDALAFSKLVLNRKDRPKRNLKKYLDWIAKMPMYGTFVKNELVSYAGSFIQLPQIWMIGGVYTAPNHRNKGYASLATSAVTKEALGKAEKAALFVRSDNLPAISVYEKIGYRKIGEKLWIDVGTRMKP
jgi:ribosomal protein S18 acetylase RimI-like enzyme